MTLVRRLPSLQHIHNITNFPKPLGRFSRPLAADPRAAGDSAMQNRTGNVVGYS